MSLPPDPSAWTIFRNRDFRLFCTARVLSGAALQMQNVAVGWLIYDITHSALALGFAGLAAFLPAVALSLVTGHVADIFDRRLVAAASYLAGAAAAGGLWLLTLAGADQVLPIYALIVLSGISRAFSQPANQALLPNLVERRQFTTAVAWNSSMVQGSFIVGPARGGVRNAARAPGGFGLSALCFATACLLLVAIRFRAARAAREKPTLATLLAGISYIRANQILLGAISLDLFAVLLGGATALLPIFAQDVLQVGPWGLGLLRSMPGLGAVSMALFLAHRPLRRRAGPRMFLSVVIFGLAVIGFGLSRSLPLSLACLFVLGASDMVSVVIRQTLMQAETPDAMRGRVSAVSSVFVGASNELGEFESGVLAALVGAVPAVVLGGLGTIAVAALWTRLFPQLWERDKLVN
jgi:MFS family permease